MVYSIIKYNAEQLENKMQSYLTIKYLIFIIQILRILYIVIE